MIAGGIKCTDNSIIIQGTKIGLVPRFIILLIAAIGFLMPFVITTVVLQDGEGLRFGLVLSWLLFFAVGIWALRLFLWNVFGQEELLINENSIRFHANFRYFKDNKKTFSKEEARLLPKPKRWLGKDYFSLILDTPKDKIETSILINSEQKDIVCNYFGACCEKSNN